MVNSLKDARLFCARPEENLSARFGSFESLSDGTPTMKMSDDEKPSSAQRLPALAPGAAMRWQAVKDIVPETAKSVLEIGCGRGAFAARLADMGLQVTALEPDPASFAQARFYSTSNLEIRNCPIEKLPASQQFDLVCAFEVIEHFEHDQTALAQWAERVSPGGTVIISAPAHKDRYGAWDDMVGHFRRYDEKHMHDLLEQSGFQDIKIRHYGFPVGYILETMRNHIAKRSMRALENTSYVERTASSGRQLQPDGRLGPFMRMANPPLCWLSQKFPHRGVGLVARARRPE